VDKITACDKFVGNRGRAWVGCTPGMASTKLAGMYDVYRHLKLTPYRAIIPKDAPFPSERHAQNWRKVGTIETVSPEAKKQIDQNGFCIYIFTPTLSFDEIEGANPNI
jgi:hypothetical protein